MILVQIQKQQRRGTRMTKKFVMSIIVTVALLVSVGFQAPAEAATPKQVIEEQVKVEFSELTKGDLQSRVARALQVCMNQWFSQNDQYGKFQFEQVPVEGQEQVEQQEPKQEQNKEESQEGNVEQVDQQPSTPPQQQQEQPAEQEQQTEQQGQLSQFEQEVVDLTNAERSKQGLAPLQANVELSNVARDKSGDMATSNYFDHTSPTYGSPFDMIRAYGITYQTAGENIAKGQRTPEEVVTAWMNSQGHRENILNGNFTHIGVGFVEQGNHWTQMFIGK